MGNDPNIKRNLILVIVTVVLIGSLGYFFYTDSPENSSIGKGDINHSGNQLLISHIDVGQSDSTLVRLPNNETILIDTGDWRQQGTGVLEYLDSKEVGRIDHLVSTHPHADHIGGNAEIINQYERQKGGIGNIYDSGARHDSQTYEDYLNAVDNNNKEILVVRRGDKIPLDSNNVTVTVLNPSAESPKDDLHRSSIALRIEYGDFSYLTTGDAEMEAEERIVSSYGSDLDSDVYQVGHHGSSSSSSEKLLNEVDPNTAIISSDYDSQYGHPHSEVLNRLDTYEIETYWTGVHDTVVVRSDGRNFTVDTESEFSTRPGEILDEKP